MKKLQKIWIVCLLIVASIGVHVQAQTTPTDEGIANTKTQDSAIVLNNTIDYEQLYNVNTSGDGVTIYGFNKSYLETLAPDAEGLIHVDLIIPATIQGKKVERINEGAFYLLSNDDSFYANVRIRSINLENAVNLKTIGGHAFYNFGSSDPIYSLTQGTLVIPEGVIGIGDTAFYGLTNITGDLILPNSVQSVGSNAFAYMGFTGILKLPQNDAFKIIDSQAFFNTPFTVLQGGIPNTVTTIGSNAFKNTEIGGELVIPDSVVNMGVDEYFEGTVSQAVKDRRGFAAFENTNITKVTIGSGVEYLPLGTFKGCTQLQEVVFSEDSSLTNIGRSAFGNTSISFFVLPNSVTSVAYDFFSDTSSLTWFYMNENNITTYAHSPNSLFFGNSSEYPNLHIICKNEEQYTYMQNVVYDAQQGKVTYLLDLRYDGLASSYEREVLFNFPINYKKTEATQASAYPMWEVDTTYVMPEIPSGKNIWSFTNPGSTAATVDSLVVGDTLYAIEIEMDIASAIITPDKIETTYDGQSKRLEVSVTTSTGVALKNPNTEELQIGDYYIVYQWYKYDSINHTGARINLGLTANNYYDVKNVNDSSSIGLQPDGTYHFGQGGYYAACYLFVVNAEGEGEYAGKAKAAVKQSGGSLVDVIITKATPTVTFPTQGQIDKSVASLADTNGVEGTFTFYDMMGDVIEDPDLLVGTNTYFYTFTPADSDNYNTLSGQSTTITGVAIPEETPNIKIDYINEQLTGFVDGATYTINGVEVVIENSTLNIDPSYFKTTIEIVRKASGDATTDSEPQSLAIIAREIITPYSDTNNGVIKGVEDTYLYRKVGSSEWLTSSAQEVYGLVGGMYEVMKPATTTSFKSDVVSVEVLPVSTSIILQSPQLNNGVLKANEKEIITLNIQVKGANGLLPSGTMTIQIDGTTIADVAVVDGVATYSYVSDTALKATMQFVFTPESTIEYLTSSAQQSVQIDKVVSPTPTPPTSDTSNILFMWMLFVVSLSGLYVVKKR